MVCRFAVASSSSGTLLSTSKVKVASSLLFRYVCTAPRPYGHGNVALYLVEFDHERVKYGSIDDSVNDDGLLGALDLKDVTSGRTR